MESHDNNVCQLLTFEEMAVRLNTADQVIRDRDIIIVDLTGDDTTPNSEINSRLNTSEYSNKEADNESKSSFFASV